MKNSSSPPSPPWPSRLRLAPALGLAALASLGGGAFAAPSYTPEQVCARMREVYIPVGERMMSCEDFPEDVRTREREYDCEASVAKCRQTTLRWFMAYMDAMEDRFRTVPQCTGKLADYMREYYGPASQDVFDEIGTIPVDENCGFLIGTYRNFRGQLNLYADVNVETPNVDLRTPDININLFGGTPQRPERPQAPPPPPPPPPPEPEIEPEPVEQVEAGPRPFIFQQNGEPPRRFHVSALATAGGYAGAAFGIGGLAVIPTRASIIPALNDALYIEVGARAIFVSLSRFGFEQDVTRTLFHITGGPRWDFYLTRELSAYWALRLGPAFSFAYAGGGFQWGTAVGGHWRFSEVMGLRLEVDGSNYGGTLNGGLSLFF